MFSNLYILLAMIFIGAIWLDWQWWAVSSNSVGDGSWSGSRELRLSMLVASGLPPVMWLDTVLKWGWRSVGCVPMMARIFPRSRRSWILLAFILLVSVLFLDPLGDRHQFEPVLVLALSIAFLWLQPPFALVLGQSSRSAGRVLKTVALKIFPLRAVALMDHARTGFSLGSFSVFTDDLRTASNREWKTVVDRLADNVQLIILDARTDSPLVIEEVGKLKSRLDRLCRTLFVVEPNGEAPALQAHGLTSQSTGIRTTHEEELGGAEPLASVTHPKLLPVAERRKRSYQMLARSIPFVALASVLVGSGLRAGGGEASRMFAWLFVMFCGFNAVSAAIAVLVQALDIVAYFLVSDEERIAARERDPLSASLRWKTGSLIPAVLQAALWAAPGMWIFSLV